MRKLISSIIFMFVTGFLTACGGFRTADGLSSFQAKATAYYPSDDKMEGGFLDRKGHRLYTVQDYLRGEAPYISVAMDAKVFGYGTRIRIPELEELYQKELEFRVVDTGGAFVGKGTSRIDICVENKTESYKKQFNSYVTVIVL